MYSIMNLFKMKKHKYATEYMQKAENVYTKIFNPIINLTIKKRATMMHKSVIICCTHTRFYIHQYFFIYRLSIDIEKG